MEPTMAMDDLDLDHVERFGELAPEDDVVVDRHGDIDDTLREVAVECHKVSKARKQEQLITIRIQPGLLRPLSPGGPSYVGWRGLSWFISVRSFAAGQAFRRTMNEFVNAVERVGFAQVERTLKGLEKQ